MSEGLYERNIKNIESRQAWKALWSRTQVYLAPRVGTLRLSQIEAADREMEWWSWNQQEGNFCSNNKIRMKSKGKKKESIEKRELTKKRKRRVKETELHVQYCMCRRPHTVLLCTYSSSYRKCSWSYKKFTS